MVYLEDDRLGEMRTQGSGHHSDREPKVLVSNICDTEDEKNICEIFR